MTIRAPVKFYITESENGKKTGKISIKDALTSILPFENKEDLIAEWDEVKLELVIKKL